MQQFKTLYVCAALNGQPLYTAPFIDSFFTQPQMLVRGTSFTGKPSTRIFANQHYVVKISSTQGHNDQATQKWLEKKRAEEIALGIYPADKTWFLVDVDGQHLAGNICQRLLPVNLIARDNITVNLRRIYAMAIHIAADHQLQLDLGLSNFALSSDDKLFYIDDDVYRFDHFLTMGQLMAAHLREYAKNIDIAYLAASIRASVISHFADFQHALLILSEHIQHCYIPKPLVEYFVVFEQGLLASNAEHENNLPQELPDKIAIFSDIHANIDALDAVLADMDQRGIGFAFVLGDVVGYGPDPNACVERLRERSFVTVKGNHDNAVATGVSTQSNSRSAQWAIDWTINNIRQENRQWLAHLPACVKTDEFWLLHGAPIDASFFNAYVYQMTYQQNLDALQQHKMPLCFHGHSHIPGIYWRDKKQQDGFTYQAAKNISLDKAFMLISAGSVGQPRDGQAAAQYAIWDKKAATLTFINVPYAIETVIKKMQQLNFPSDVYLPLTRLLSTKKKDN